MEKWKNIHREIETEYVYTHRREQKRERENLIQEKNDSVTRITRKINWYRERSKGVGNEHLK